MTEPTKPTDGKLQHWGDVSKLSEHIAFLEAETTRLTKELADTKHVLLDSQCHALVLAKEVLALQQELAEASEEREHMRRYWNGTCELLQASQQRETALRKALVAICDHDYSRWQDDGDGGLERQLRPQEIAKAALAATGERMDVGCQNPCCLALSAVWDNEEDDTLFDTSTTQPTNTTSTDPASTVQCPCVQADARHTCSGCIGALHSLKCQTPGCEGSGRIPKPVGEETDD